MAFKMNGWSAFTAQPPPPPKPQIGDYSTREEYLDALRAWKREIAKATIKSSSPPPVK